MSTYEVYKVENFRKIEESTEIFEGTHSELVEFINFFREYHNCANVETELVIADPIFLGACENGYQYIDIEKGNYVRKIQIDMTENDYAIVRFHQCGSVMLFHYWRDWNNCWYGGNYPATYSDLGALVGKHPEYAKLLEI